MSSTFHSFDQILEWNAGTISFVKSCYLGASGKHNITCCKFHSDYNTVEP